MRVHVHTRAAHPLIPSESNNEQRIDTERDQEVLLRSALEPHQTALTTTLHPLYFTDEKSSFPVNYQSFPYNYFVEKAIVLQWATALLLKTMPQHAILIQHMRGNGSNTGKFAGFHQAQVSNRGSDDENVLRGVPRTVRPAISFCHTYRCSTMPQCPSLPYLYGPPSAQQYCEILRRVILNPCFLRSCTFYGIFLWCFVPGFGIWELCQTLCTV